MAGTSWTSIDVSTLTAPVVEIKFEHVTIELV